MSARVIMKFAQRILCPLSLGERPQSPIFARIESMNLVAVAVLATASACRAEAPLRGVPPLFRMPLCSAKIIRRNRKRSALRPASKDNGRSSKPTARLRFMGRVGERGAVNESFIIGGGTTAMTVKPKQKRGAGMKQRGVIRARK